MTISEITSVFKVGDMAAWTMIDGHTMAGRIISVGFTSSLMVERVDGSQVTVKACDCRQATPEDVLLAVKFFAYPWDQRPDPETMLRNVFDLD